MAELNDLYQEILLEHNSKPRNYRKIQNPTITAQGYNPLCGDQVNLYIKLDGEVVEDIAFQGHGCAISRASASMMTQAATGRTTEEIMSMFAAFHEMVTNPESQPDTNALADLEILSGVTRYPSRIKCATLPWHTLNSALQSHPDSGTSMP